MAPIIPDGEYWIRNAAFEDLYVDLSGNSTAPNTPICGWELHKGANQKWRVTTTNGVNQYVIKSAAGESYISQSDIRIYPPLIAGQPVPLQWSIEPVGDNLFRIAFVYANGVISLPSSRKGSQLNLEEWIGERNQKWLFESA